MLSLTTARNGLLLLCVVAASMPAGAQENAVSSTDTTAASRIWQQMLVAKGDTRAVRTLRTLEMRRPLLSPKPRAVQVVMAQLPEHWWWYFEEPKPLWDELRVLDFETGTAWVWEGSSADVKTFERHRFDMDQVIEARTIAIFFGALGQFQPEPISTQTIHEGFTTRDQLTLRWRDYTLVYDLDRKRHLPLQVDLQKLVPPHDGLRPFTSHEVYAMSDYHNIAGIMMPGKVQSYGVWSRRVVEINPVIDATLFTEKPKAITGATAGWRRFSATQ